MTIFVIVWVVVAFLAAVAINVFLDPSLFEGWRSRHTGKVVVPREDVDLAIGGIVFWPLTLLMVLFLGLFVLFGTGVVRSFNWLCARIRSLAGLP